MFVCELKLIGMYCVGVMHCVKLKRDYLLCTSSNMPRIYIRFLSKGEILRICLTSLLQNKLTIIFEIRLWHYLAMKKIYY